VANPRTGVTHERWETAGAATLIRETLAALGVEQLPVRWEEVCQALAVPKLSSVMGAKDGVRVKKTAPPSLLEQVLVPIGDTARPRAGGAERGNS
jgi:hypothetical protein